MTLEGPPKSSSEKTGDEPSGSEVESSQEEESLLEEMTQKEKEELEGKPEAEAMVALSNMAKSVVEERNSEE